MDGSVVYGSTDEDLKNLRLFKSGKLQYSYMPSRKSLLPRLHHFHEGECVLTSNPRLFCFHAGDARVNEQPGLAAMHTVWLRQHNLIAEKLHTMNPQWSEVRRNNYEEEKDVDRKYETMIFVYCRKLCSRKPEKL